MPRSLCVTHHTACVSFTKICRSVTGRDKMKEGNIVSQLLIKANSSSWRFILNAVVGYIV